MRRLLFWDVLLSWFEHIQVHTYVWNVTTTWIPGGEKAANVRMLTCYEMPGGELIRRHDASFAFGVDDLADVDIMSFPHRYPEGGVLSVDSYYGKDDFLTRGAPAGVTLSFVRPIIVKRYACTPFSNESEIEVAIKSIPVWVSDESTANQIKGILQRWISGHRVATPFDQGTYLNPPASDLPWNIELPGSTERG